VDAGDIGMIAARRHAPIEPGSDSPASSADEHGAQAVGRLWVEAAGSCASAAGWVCRASVRHDEVRGCGKKTRL